MAAGEPGCPSLLAKLEGFGPFSIIYSGLPKHPLFGTPTSAYRVVHWRPHIFLPMRSSDLYSHLALTYES